MRGCAEFEQFPSLSLMRATYLEKSQKCNSKPSQSSRTLLPHHFPAPASHTPTPKTLRHDHTYRHAREDAHLSRRAARTHTRLSEAFVFTHPPAHTTLRSVGRKDFLFTVFEIAATWTRIDLPREVCLTHAHTEATVFWWDRHRRAHTDNFDTPVRRRTRAHTWEGRRNHPFCFLEPSLTHTPPPLHAAVRSPCTALYESEDFDA